MVGFAKEDCGELMDRTVASSMIVARPGAEVKGAAGRESTGLVRTSGLAGPSNRDLQPQILKNSLRRYIQKRMSQNTRRTATPWRKGA